MDKTWVIELGVDGEALTENQRRELLEKLCALCGASFARTIGFCGPDSTPEREG